MKYGVVLASALALGGCAAASMPPATGTAAKTNALPGAARAASGYRLLHSFGKGKDGADPAAPLLAFKGELYGTTTGGGRYRSDSCNGGCGTVYAIGPSGSERVLYSFGKNNDGTGPLAGLIQVGGALYGTTANGGAYCGSPSTTCGTAFEVSIGGTERLLHTFGGTSADGTYPIAPLIDFNGALYGTTSEGGSVRTGNCPYIAGCGTLFRIDTTGSSYAVLHEFGKGSDGAEPEGTLVDVGGVLYGTTVLGGRCAFTRGCGTIYSASAQGTERSLYRFYGQGVFPEAGLIAVQGSLYGAAAVGGPYSGDSYDSGGGVAFAFTPSGGKYRSLHDFGALFDGNDPVSSLIDVNGTLYGTTADGGKYGRGTVFSIKPDGSDYRLVHDFGNGTDGAYPTAALVEMGGILYGTTTAGGKYAKSSSAGGTVFALTP